MKKGSALLALLTPSKGKVAEEDGEETEPKSRKNPLLSEDDEDEDMGDDAEGEEAAQAFLDAIEAKDAKGLLEAFSHLQAVC